MSEKMSYFQSYLNGVVSGMAQGYGVIPLYFTIFISEQILSLFLFACFTQEKVFLHVAL